MGKHEAELNSIAQAGRWEIPNLDALHGGLGALTTALRALAGSDSWEGAAANRAAISLSKTASNLETIQDALDDVAKILGEANRSRDAAIAAAAELPSTTVDPFWENLARGGAAVVHPVLGTLAADGAIDAIEGLLGGQREEAAKAALDTLTAANSNHAAEIAAQRAVIYANTPVPDVFSVTLAKPENPTIPTPDLRWNDPSYTGPGSSGSSVPRYHGPSVDGSLVGSTPGGPYLGGPGTGTPGLPSAPGTLPGGPGTGPLPGGPGSPGTGPLPGGPGGTSPGELPGTHPGGGGGLVGGIGGGAAGAAALAAGAKAAGVGGARVGGLGGLGSGVGGAGGVGVTGGAGGASGTGSRGTSGLLGRPGGLEGGAAGSGTAGSNATGNSAGAGARGGMGMMGGQGAGGGGSERERRNGLGGPIAPKLDDEGEAGPRSPGARAGGR